MPSKIFINILLVALGGATGSVCRYMFSLVLAPVGSLLPWGTMAANIVGSLVIGFLMELVAIKSSLPPEIRLLLATGFCGGLTTLSSLVFEANNLMRDREFLLAMAYGFGTLVCAFLALWAGILLCRLIFLRT